MLEMWRRKRKAEGRNEQGTCTRRAMDDYVIGIGKEWNAGSAREREGVEADSLDE